MKQTDDFAGENAVKSSIPNRRVGFQSLRADMHAKRPAEWKQ